MLRTLALRLGASALVVGLAGCASTVAPPSIVPQTTAADRTSPGASAPDDLALDPESRELLAVLEPGDDAVVIVATTWTDELSQAARGAGMRVEIVAEQGTIQIDGPVGRIMRLLDGVPMSSVAVRDSADAMRSVPIERPVVDPPTPGRPYLEGWVGVELTRVTIPSPGREAMLGVLAQSIQTVDGRPYATLRLEGSCGTDKAGPSCSVIGVGLAVGSVGREDDWSVRATERTGPGGVLDKPFTTSVPRPLVRAAEWAARHDERALARIRTYESCCDVTWDPARPGVITLLYDRLCTVALEPGRDVADTGVCVDQLAIAVDLRSGAVVSVEGPPAG